MDRDFWEEQWATDPEGAGVPDRIVAAEAAGLEPGRALDLGCGAGEVALALAVRGWAVTGVDLAERAVALARARAAARGLAATFVAADATRWSPPHPYELVVSTFALPGGAASGRLLRTARRALAPGGTLLVAEWDRAMAAPWGLPAAALPTPAEIAAELTGLVVESAETRTLAGLFEAPDDPRAGRPVRVAVVRARRP